MCSAGVRFWIRIDRDRQLRYAPIQGATARELRARDPEIPQGVDSIIFLDEGKPFVGVKAIARTARYLRWPWRIGRFLFYLPAWLTWPMYRLVARNRYRLFGKHKLCPIPEAKERDLFLP